MTNNQTNQTKKKENKKKPKQKNAKSQLNKTVVQIYVCVLFQVWMSNGCHMIKNP